MISEEKIKRIVNKIVESYQPEKIMLFGSYAKNIANENSDLDLLVIKQTSENPLQRFIQLETLIRAERKGIPLDLFIYTPDEFNMNFSFTNEVRKSSKTLYQS